MMKKLLISLVTILALPLNAQAGGEHPSYPVERSFPPYFLEHQAYFEPQVYQIGDLPIWSINNPEGWAANTIVIEGDEGLIVYDTGLSRQHGEAAMKELRKFSDKPIVAVFYSHHHPDHYNGTDAFVSEADVKAGKVKIYAWHNFVEEMNSEWGATAPAQAIRAAYYIGMALPKEDRHHHGCCGPRYGGVSGYIAPTDTIEQDITLTIAGVELEVFLTGGEALSEFGIYLPKYKTMLVADEIFQSLPNIYTIRGAKFRDAEGYLRAMDRVLSYEVDHLLGSHLRPIEGQQQIRQTVEKYRDLVQWIHDQSVRYINKGYTMPELKAKFTDVPDYLENGVFSKEMYGTLEHIAPQMFAGYIGYFNGDAIEYKPTPPVELARRHIELMGGRDQVFAAAEKAYLADDPQWAAELLTYLIRVDNGDMPARKLKAAAFRKLGYAELNTTWRSWYLTSARELDGELEPKTVADRLKGVIFAKVEAKPLFDILTALRYQVNAEEAGQRHIVVNYAISGPDEQVSAILRRGVLLLKPTLSDEADVTLKMSRETFNLLATQQRTLDQVIDEGLLKLEGSRDVLNQFLSSFDQNIFADRVALR